MLKERWYQNGINMLMFPAGGDNNWFDAGMMEENMVGTLWASGGVRFATPAAASLDEVRYPIRLSLPSVELCQQRFGRASTSFAAHVPIRRTFCRRLCETPVVRQDVAMDVNSRTDFLKLAAIVEGGILLLALAVGRLIGIEPWQHVQWTLSAVGLGLVGTLPIFAVYALASDTRSVAVEMMGKPLSQCRWYDLLLLATLAGVGEELLFRGVLQPWLSEFSPLFGLLVANVLFGIMHMVTPAYAVIAGGIGLYLSALAYGVPRGNLLSAVIAHGVYDYVAFLLIIREYRSASQTAAIGEECVPSEDA